MTLRPPFASLSSSLEQEMPWFLWKFEYTVPPSIKFCSSAHTVIKARPLGLNTRTISSNALKRRSSVEKWWITAMEITASWESLRMGNWRASAHRTFAHPFLWAILISPSLMSKPIYNAPYYQLNICCISGLVSKSSASRRVTCSLPNWNEKFEI